MKDSDFLVWFNSLPNDFLFLDTRSRPRSCPIAKYFSSLLQIGDVGVFWDSRYNAYARVINITYSFSWITERVYEFDFYFSAPCTKKEILDVLPHWRTP